jgi:hypothetical protein
MGLYSLSLIFTIKEIKLVNIFNKAAWKIFFFDLMIADQINYRHQQYQHQNTLKIVIGSGPDKSKFWDRTHQRP